MLYMHKKRKAFSLIELMVVIAIISILAAIAVPLYLRYVMATRLQQSTSAVLSLVQKAALFRTMQGHFPNAYELGLSGTVGSTVADNYLAVQAVPYFYNYFAAHLTVSDISSNCGARGSLRVNLDPIALGFGSAYLGLSNGNGVVLEIFYWNYNNVIYVNPQYRFCGDNGCQPDGTSSPYMPPNWVNEGTYQYSLSTNNMAIYNAYNNATCA